MMNALLRCKAVSSQEAGQGLAEYALLLLLIMLPAVMALTFFGEGVQNLYAIILAAFP